MISGSRGSPTGDMWWRHFRSKSPNRVDIAQLPVDHTCIPPILWGHVTFGHITSGSQATSGHAQWYILYYYYGKKKVRELVAHAHVITSGHVTVGDVISGQGCFRWRHFRYNLKYGLNRADILLILNIFRIGNSKWSPYVNSLFWLLSTHFYQELCLEVYL